mmetsp:Transcript_84659/g.202923  ORF Transcript_84659/g.202923 Transcript_84659/m.202923 type:complete len:411 (+) Transcript_84659:80-1312(+)
MEFTDRHSIYATAVDTVHSNESPPPLDLVGGVFRVGRKLGSGSFGRIYQAINAQNGQEVAVKVEGNDGSHPMLLYEAKLLKHLEGGQGFSSVYFSGREGGFNVMVMDLLGPSLEDVFSSFQRKFSMKTVLMLGEQMINRIEYLHSKDFIHRDLKPDNFLIGSGSKFNLVYLIDFGLAKRYRDSNNQHIPWSQRKSLTGTARYASVNAHKASEQSRRDDMEALGYILVYFSLGVLPWQGLQAGTKEQKYKRIMEIKEGLSVEKLCKGSSSALASYVSYCKSLDFEDRPDYAYLRRLFKDFLANEGLQNDGVFDWSDGETLGPGQRRQGSVSKAKRSRRGREMASSVAVATEAERFTIRHSSKLTSRQKSNPFPDMDTVAPIVEAEAKQPILSTLGERLSKFFGCCRAQSEE